MTELPIFVNPNKKVIYTCITGGYEKPTDNFEKKEDYQYILISDEPIQTNSWENYVVDFSFLGDISAVKKQRYIKIMYMNVFTNAKLFVWIDSNTSINGILYNYIETNSHNICTFKKHPDRDCTYEECKAVLSCKKDSKENIDNIKSFLEKENFPEHYGLEETNIVLRQNNYKVMELMKLWWGILHKYSHRDQLSLMYCIWKLNCKDMITSVETRQFPAKFHRK